MIGEKSLIFNIKRLAAGKHTETATAISSCISPPELSHGESIWHRGIYSLRLGGAEFIKGDTQLADAKVFPHCAGLSFSEMVLSVDSDQLTSSACPR